MTVTHIAVYIAVEIAVGVAVGVAVGIVVGIAVGIAVEFAVGIAVEFAVDFDGQHIRFFHHSLNQFYCRVNMTTAAMTRRNYFLFTARPVIWFPVTAKTQKAKQHTPLTSTPRCTKKL